MEIRIDLKSAVIGGVAVLALGLVIGAAGERPSGTIGRFSLVTGGTSDLTYLVDTATGRVWRSGDRGWKDPKLGDRHVPDAAESSAFLGHWRSVPGSEEDLGLHLEPEGRARATGDGDAYEGAWRAEGTRIVITIDDEVVVGEVTPDGDLVLWEKEGGDRMTFRKVD
jgi:hypothetical protein